MWCGMWHDEEGAAQAQFGHLQIRVSWVLFVKPRRVQTSKDSFKIPSNVGISSFTKNQVPYISDLRNLALGMIFSKFRDSKIFLLSGTLSS